MAELNAEQKQKVSEWAEDGASLNDIQTRLKSELGVTLTYMECRLVVMELGLSLKDKTVKPVVVAPVEPVASQPEPEPDWETEEPGGAAFPMPEEGEVGGAEGAVPFVMEADELTVPGMLVSGTATFSDGTLGKWSLDQMGRLSLKTDKTSYQPPPADVPKFQQGLEKILIKKGLY